MEPQLRLEFKSGTSSKFWEPRVEGRVLIVRFGRIGQSGQERSTLCSSQAEVEEEYRRRIREQLADGYKPVTSKIYRVENSTIIQDPKILDYVQISTDCSTVVEELCAWLTVSRYYKMTAEQLQSIWKRLCGGHVNLNLGLAWLDKAPMLAGTSGKKVLTLYSRAYCDCHKFLWSNRGNDVCLAARKK